MLIDNDNNKATAGRAGKGAANKSATKIVWEPAQSGGTINVWAETRPSPGRNVKFAPTSCGVLYLNEDGAAAFEIDPGTGEPFVDQFGERLPPILESNQLCLVAVSDVDLSGSIVPDGSGDEDGDGLTDLEEACDVGTDPCLEDTDEDGVLDGADACPLDAAIIDADGDGCEDAVDPSCFSFTNTPSEDLTDNTYFDNCIAATGNQVSITLSDSGGAIVYQGTGTKVGTWTNDQITSTATFTTQWTHHLHDRAILLDTGDLLTISGQNSQNGGCHGDLGNGYVIIVAAPGGGIGRVKLLVTSYLHFVPSSLGRSFRDNSSGGTGDPLNDWTTEHEISFNSGAVMDSCDVVFNLSDPMTPFFGKVQISVVP